jgi:hypothetical protein
VLFLKWMGDKKLAWKTNLEKVKTDDDSFIHEELGKQVNRLEQLPAKKNNLNTSKKKQSKYK